MRIRKWLMKQQWRILQIRGIWGVFYGVFILAGLYVGYVPFFNDMGILGPLTFALTILLVFLIIGYIYDRVFVMWAPSQEVTQERNPYMYVPSPKDHIFWFPLYSTILSVTEELAEKVGADTTAIKETKSYYSKLQALRPEINQDIDEGIRLRQEFISKYPFSNVFDDTKEK
ncbi:hypothetical protein EU527_04220 [Candidatus Thorarchaeota archaeon]|nr:MAG: hypothetical protein EU527_04220 [Candidatus Thorarchaeota archaeon]